MAIAPLNEFKSKTVDLTTTFQTVIEVPVSVATIVLDARAVNVTGIDEYNPPFNCNITVKLIKADEEGESIIVPNMEVPYNDALEFISGKFVMQEGDTLSAKASDDNRAKLFISYLETSA